MTSGILSLLVGYFIAGSFSPIFVKLGVKEFPPLIFTFLRFILAFLFILPLYLREKKFNLSYSKLALINSFFFAANMALYSIGIQYTSAISGSIIYTLVPLFVGILDFFAGERPTKSKIIGTVIALSGLLFLIYQSISKSDTLSLGTPLGNLLICLATICWAGYLFISKRVHQEQSSIGISLSNFLFTFLILIPLLPFENSLRLFEPAAITRTGVISVVGAGLFSSALYIFLLQVGIKKLGSFLASVFSYIAPLFTALTAIPILGEKITAATVIGGFLIIFGVFYATTYPLWIKEKNYSK